MVRLRPSRKGVVRVCVTAWLRSSNGNHFRIQTAQRLDSSQLLLLYLAQFKVSSS